MLQFWSYFKAGLGCSWVSLYLVAVAWTEISLYLWDLFSAVEFCCEHHWFIFYASFYVYIVSSVVHSSFDRNLHSFSVWRYRWDFIHHELWSTNRNRVNMSAMLNKKYWKESQNMLIGNGCSTGNASSMLLSLATPFLLTSMIAATAMERDERIRSTPMHCKCVIPVEYQWICLEKAHGCDHRKGQKLLRTQLGRLVWIQAGCENAWWSWCSWWKPCWIEKVWSCAKQRIIIIEQQNISSILEMILAFSTFVTLHSFHGFGVFSFPACTHTSICILWCIIL